MIITKIPEHYADLGIQLSDPSTAIGRYFPDFLVIGPWRTGTTWLSEMMRRHPELFMTDLKETYYFSHLTGLRKQQVPKEFNWYLDLFDKNVSGKRLMGEASATYATGLRIEVIRFIYTINPAIKVIFGVRHPVSRAWSHAKMNIWLEPDEYQSLPEKERYRKALSKEYIIDAGRYSHHIERWHSVIPRNQFYLFEYDRLRQDPVSAFAGICSFLGVGHGLETMRDLADQVGKVAHTDSAEMPREAFEQLARKYESELKTMARQYSIRFAEESLHAPLLPPVVIMNTLVPGSTETFIANHIRYLGAATISLSDYYPLGTSINVFHLRSIVRWFRAKRSMKRLYSDLSKLNRTILVEYGTYAVLALPALRRLHQKFVVHFHGYDAHKKKVVEDNAKAYRELFRTAHAIVVVSLSMKKALIELGANPDKLHHIVCGVDIHQFQMTDVSKNPPVFFACGRFVEKKAPHLLIRAFYKAQLQRTDLKLRIAGDGALLTVCRELSGTLRLQEHITFLGAIDHDSVAKEMMSCRAFLQHSIVASDGDSEGTPVSILEAGSCGVPVIATRHAGIVDVVLENKTGILVDEHDVDAMAKAIVYLADHPDIAATLGMQARQHISENYTMETSIEKLNALLK